MTNVIIYPNGSGGICMVVPTGELAFEEVARKDVPADTPYMIVERSSLPDDFSFFEAWEADFSNPDGHGIGAEAWFAEQAAKKTEEVTP